MADIYNSDEGYRYLPGSSTTGIIYHDTQPSFFYWPYARVRHPVPPLLYPGAITPERTKFIACSSSRGLVAFYNKETNLYSIRDPLVLPMDLYTETLPETPMPHHPYYNTAVVLANTSINPQEPPFVYDLMCLVSLVPDIFTMDVYTSANGLWQSYKEFTLPVGVRINLNSGVSCGRCAFWLTNMPGILVSFNAETQILKLIKGLPDATLESEALRLPGTRLQLGRVGDRAGLVLVNAAIPRVELYLLGTNRSEPAAILNLTIQEDVNWKDYATGREFRDDQLTCRVIPWPVRFESFKMEVLLWVDCRVVVWENNTNHLGLEGRRALLLPGHAGICVQQGFAHVQAKALPASFAFGINVDEEDNRESDGVSS